MPDTEKTIFLEHNLRDRAEQVLAEMRSSQEKRKSDEIQPYLLESKITMHGAGTSDGNKGKSLDLAATYNTTSILIDCSGSGGEYDPLTPVFLKTFPPDQILETQKKMEQRILNYEQVKAKLEQIKEGSAPNSSLDSLDDAFACVELHGERLRIRAKGSCAIAVIIATNANQEQSLKWNDQIGVNMVYLGADAGRETSAKQSLNADGNLSEMPFDYVQYHNKEVIKGSSTEPIEFDIPLMDADSSSKIIGYMIFSDGAETSISDSGSTSIQTIDYEDFIHMQEKIKTLGVQRTSPDQDIFSIFMTRLDLYITELATEEAVNAIADDITIVRSMILPNPEFKKLAEEE